MSNPIITKLNKTDNKKITFTIENIDVSIINAIRRTLLKDIEIFVLDTSEDSCIIEKNTSRLTNEIIKQRLDCIPVHINDMQFPYEQYIITLNKQNQDNNIVYVTSEDFKIVSKLTSKEISTSEKEKIFPKCEKTGMFIDILRLRPKISNNLAGEKIEMNCNFKKTSASENSSYNVVTKVAFSNTIDINKSKEAWNKHKATIVDNIEDEEKKTTPKKTTPKKDSPVVYVASMNMRGKWAVAPDGCKKINVTSSQAKKSKYRLAFSPMTPIEGGYKGFYCFENYWQSGKRYDGIIDVDKQLEWWKTQEKGRRRYPLGKNKKILHAVYPGFKQPLDYISSRKLVYVPEYYKLINNNQVLKDLKEEAKNKCLVIYDFDGPRNNDKTPTVEKLTLKLLKEKINDPRFPFGHGYIVAATIAGLNPSDYIS